MPSSLITLAEQSGWKKTGRYAEVLSLCAAFEKKYPGKVRSHRFGVTPEGRPLMALAASADGALSPGQARRKGRPVVLFQGCIHAGEVDGKDAGFWLLRELLDGQRLPGALSRVTAVFVPVFNADGHERFGPNNRPNQNGPERTGWRVTAQNINLNRDYAKADSPEMRAMLSLLNAWDPILYLDLHATDGAKFEHDIAVILEPSDFGPPVLHRLGMRMRVALYRKLEAQAHLPIVEFYPTFNKAGDPSSGFSMRIGAPRMSTNYWPLRNRFAALVETHSWKDYATRVRATRDVVMNFLDIAAVEGRAWMRAAHACDQADSRGEGAEIPLTFERSGKSRLIDFRGYAYTSELSDVSGRGWIRYDDARQEIWKVPFYDEVRPVFKARVPRRGGYVVPASWAALTGERLKLHGFSLQPILKTGRHRVEAFRAEKVKFQPHPSEGRFGIQIEGAWTHETREVPAGSLYVPASQRGRRLLAHLLDPQGPDSFSAWGFFSATLEQKEYMEDYVIEEEARKMMARDPALRKEFEKKLGEDPAFAGDPAARLAFFYRRHPSWDERKDLYPIYRVQSPLKE